MLSTEHCIYILLPSTLKEYDKTWKAFMWRSFKAKLNILLPIHNLSQSKWWNINSVMIIMIDRNWFSKNKIYRRDRESVCLSQRKDDGKLFQCFFFVIPFVICRCLNSKLNFEFKYEGSGMVISQLIWAMLYVCILSVIFQIILRYVGS